MDEFTLEQQQAIALANARARASQAQQDTVSIGNDIVPSKGLQTSPIPYQKTMSDKIAQAMSGGKYGSLQDLFYGGQQPEQSMLGKAGQLLDQSGIEGLTGISALGQLGTVGTSLGKNIPNIAPTVSKATNLLNDLPSKYMGFVSNVNPEAYKTIYNINKSGNKELKTAIKEITPLGQKLNQDAIYNYTRKMFNTPHDIAITAEDFTRGKNARGLGAWDVGADRAYAEFPNLPAAEARAKMSAYKPFNELTDSEKLKQAIQSGVDTSSFLPFKNGDTLADFAKTAIKVGLNAPLEFLSSPRIARMAAATAGKTAKIAGKVGNKVSSLNNILPDPSLEDLFKYGLLSPINAYQGNQ